MPPSKTRNEAAHALLDLLALSLGAAVALGFARFAYALVLLGALLALGQPARQS